MRLSRASYIKQIVHHHIHHEKKLGGRSSLVLREGLWVQCKEYKTSSRRFAAVSSSEPVQDSPVAKKRKLISPIMVHKGLSVSRKNKVWQNAALLIDKDTGWTSFDICGKLRGMLQMKKVNAISDSSSSPQSPTWRLIGHAGTLDPNATGLLIVCTGKGTKSIHNFVAQQKIYTGTMKLGESTLSYDADTEVSETQSWEHVTDDDLGQAAKEFTGDLMQIPPMYSAIKIKGERLYKAARRGEEIDRPARPVHVFALELLRQSDSRRHVDFSVTCSKGTYVRSLVHDLGKYLGTVAHMTALRREAIGDHQVSDAWKIQELDAALKAADA